ncbi:UDP-N-acetylmuramoylalanine--D-glutamate ligase [Actinoalloteichus hoggarensis]|uniref:UDP-N-acetylmuramoylalanine--D-glutamate ligase n=1 Tax=Actinoalloteichus hoggarensis TaxID=1470176 RepID=A0A221W0Y0_9PSEU|nr:UDP-N-acetylmuramoyl-L-alanine--D-glutamate ligase [Actinoalloteichus hoggarensis]ASO19446.1 UDP-N-acetylmuramoylalanine--D-glutamate ligase [Actinoalloteichus hoggarensis]MBB5919849.1 UDP-N-acetylmuramoylalanine--D-glutamate ligase [Actinoalloteichus hoggarensis]
MDGSPFAGLSVLVAGAGVSGVSAARALLAQGATVSVVDGSPARIESMNLPAVTGLVGVDVVPPGIDLVVTSPGWRPTAPLLVAAADAGVEVIGEVELAWRLDQARPDGPADWLVVTGTNGKTTTVSMVESILLAAGLDAVACGNVGLPVVDAVLSGHRVLAVELSSFQLHWSSSVRPAAGLVLNVAEDHLDWHGSAAAYGAAKARALLGPVAVAGVDDEPAAALLAASPADRRIGVTAAEPAEGQFGVSAGVLVDRVFGPDGDAVSLIDAELIRPVGPTGIVDALAAAALTRSYGVAPESVEAGLRDFRPGAHRAVVVAEHDGIVYVDDSKATNPHAAAASLRGHARVVWLAGGLLKGASVDDLVAETGDRLAAAVLFGADRALIAAALARHAPDVPVYEVATGDDKAMREAVDIASQVARPGETVLLAPAAASMDMFTDYAHRGDSFAAAVLDRQAAEGVAEESAEGDGGAPERDTRPVARPAGTERADSDRIGAERLGGDDTGAGRPGSGADTGSDDVVERGGSV